jgi:hypothetical protein
MTKSVLRVVMGVALLAAVATMAFAALTAQDVENKLRTKMLSKWTAKNLKLDVVPYPSQARTDKGQFSSITLKADSAEDMKQHIKITDVLINVRDVDLDLAKLWKSNEVVVQSRKLGSCHVKLMETDVNRLLALKHTPIENLRADFGPGLITFTGKYRFNVKLAGTLSVRNRQEIWFEPTQASVGVVGIPAGIVKQFLSKLNPLIDMVDVPLQPQIKSIQVTESAILLTG